MYARRASRYTGASLVDRRMCTTPVCRATVPSGKKFRFAPASPYGAEMGVPDGPQERHVLVAVGVTVAGGQVDVVPGGKRLHRGDLAGTPQCPTRQPTGEDTVLGLQLGAQQVLDPEPPRQRTSLEPGGRGRDYHGVAAPLVRLGQPPRVVEQRRRNALDEQPLSQLDHVVVGPACPPSDAALHQLGELVLAEGSAQASEHRVRSLGGSHLEVTQPV